MLPLMYLAGPINALSDSEAIDWRREVMEALAHKFNFLDPMARDFRSIEDDHTAEIVEGPQSGEADSSVMAYNYRLILTRDPANQIMLSKPANFDPAIAKQARERLHGMRRLRRVMKNA